MARYDYRTMNGRVVAAVLIGGSCLAFIIGILIGRFATCPDSDNSDGPSPVNYPPGFPVNISRDADVTIIDDVINSVSSDNIRINLKMLTEHPHIAGKEQNFQLAKTLQEEWERYGLDHVVMTPYRVMLSYPPENDTNFVELLDHTNHSLYKSPPAEPHLGPGSSADDVGVVPPFNAYSGAGDVYVCNNNDWGDPLKNTGDIVYANYGRDEDFLFLERNVSINITGKIVLARYGRIFRGDKVHLAEQHAAAGVILFSDPEDYTDGGNLSSVYPHGWWLPPEGTQRGTTKLGDGDPLTPDYPAIDTAYRGVSSEDYLPSIPVHPIGYKIAVKLMESLGGAEVPVAWRGLMNVTYRFGGSFSTAGMRAHIHIQTRNQNVTIHNVIGTITGAIEPDRYVLIGNHRDAWVFGALDPSSGTAVMSEIARVLGEKVKSGRWRPRRSILFCSWGAEEYGLIGSTEWVEHYTKSLGARAIAYLNVDIAVQGQYSLRASGTPLITKVLNEAAKRVPNPNADEVAKGRATVFDTWKEYLRLKGVDVSDKNKPLRPTLPGSGSDYTPFRDRLGVPVADIRYTWHPDMKISSYPLYHSAYETFYLVDKVLDPGFKFHRAVGQVWVDMARSLADSLILPFDVLDYHSVMKDLVDTFISDHGDKLNAREDTKNFTRLLRRAQEQFTDDVLSFYVKVIDTDFNKENPYLVRRVNDQLMQLNRAFLDPAGLPGRRLKRHILLAESNTDGYAQSTFPGLTDTLRLIELGQDASNQWEVFKHHFSVILFTIRSAASTLRDVTEFMDVQN